MVAEHGGGCVLPLFCYYLQILKYANEQNEKYTTIMLGVVAEPEFQYGEEAFEAYQQTVKAVQAVVSEVKIQEVKNKSR